MDLNLLRVFQAILDEGSLTLAGNRLHLTQPAVSAALGRLRVLFDDPLFVRTREGMRPTPVGLGMAPPIARALHAVQDALRHAHGFDPATSERVFRVSMSDVAEMVFLPAICDRLRQLAPNVLVRVEPTAQGEIAEALRTGRLDCAIGNLPALKSETKNALLFRESYCCITRERAGLPDRQVLTVDELQAFSFIHVRSAESDHGQVAQALLEHGIKCRIALEISHFSILPLILAKSDLAVVVPLRVGRLFSTEGRVRVYGLPVALPEVDVTLRWHEEFDNEHGNRWLRQMIGDLLQTYGRNH